MFGDVLAFVSTHLLLAGVYHNNGMTAVSVVRAAMLMCQLRDVSSVQSASFANKQFLQNEEMNIVTNKEKKKQNAKKKKKKKSVK